MFRKNKFWGLIEPVIFGIVLAMVIKFFFVQAYIIPSSSMLDTLLIGDCLLANKMAYRIKIPFISKPLVKINDPERRDIIIFKYPRNKRVNYIKRVVGLPGETIEIRNNKTFINNKKLVENYVIFRNNLSGSVNKNFGPVKIPKNHVFVMGDNRNNSSDSRDWGFVNLDDIKGKAMIIYWSWDKNKKLPRLSRLFNTLF